MISSDKKLAKCGSVHKWQWLWQTHLYLEKKTIWFNLIKNRNVSVFYVSSMCGFLADLLLTAIHCNKSVSHCKLLAKEGTISIWVIYLFIFIVIIRCCYSVPSSDICRFLFWWVGIGCITEVNFVAKVGHLTFNYPEFLISWTLKRILYPVWML